MLKCGLMVKGAAVADGETINRKGEKLTYLEDSVLGDAIRVVVKNLSSQQKWIMIMRQYCSVVR